MVAKKHTLWHRFGLELKRQRDLAGVSQAQIAAAIHCSPSMVSALQQGTRVPKRDTAEALDAALNTGGTLTRLWVNLSNQSDTPDWFRGVVVMEREATEIREFQSILIPGLLQTEDYARTILQSGRPWDTEAEIERLVEARIQRSEVFARTTPALTWFVLDHIAIRRCVGTSGVMRDQLEHLLNLIESRKVRLQVVADGTQPHPGLTPPFRTMAFKDRPTVAYAERVMGGDLLDDPEQVRQCGTIFGALQAEAMSTRASADLIRETQKEFV